MRKLAARLRALWDLLRVIDWACHYCHTQQVTSVLVWDSIKYSLICRECNCMQPYTEAILPIDPTPARGRGRRANEAA